MTYKIHTGDIVSWANNYEGERFHACFCDPPYHLTSIVNRFGKANINDDTQTSAKSRGGVDSYSRFNRGFMGQEWDGGDVAFRAETWEAIGKCLLPGAYLMAFGGTRTWHRLACAIEDAGFEIRDTICWIYGSGFPKSLNVSKAIDKSEGKTGEVIGEKELWGHNAGSGAGSFSKNKYEGQTGVRRTEPILANATEMAIVWDGYGTALKPGFEPIILARKPVEGTVANNCIEYGCGAVNIDGCRVGTEGGGTHCNNRDKDGHCLGHKDDNGLYGETIHPDIEPIPINKLEKWSGFGEEIRPDYEQEINTKGRYPANVIHDGSNEVIDVFPNSKSGKAGFHPRNGDTDIYGGNSLLNSKTKHTGTVEYGDAGSASRYFYCAKASKQERDAGCEDMENKLYGQSGGAQGAIKRGEATYQEGNDISFGMNAIKIRRNNHPTVKPLALTEYLAKLIFPPSYYSPRRILVPFSGSGSEMIGSHLAGWENIIGVELSEEYVNIAEARLKHWTNIPKQLDFK